MTYNKFKKLANRRFAASCERLAQAFCKTLDVTYHPDDCWWVSYGGVFAFQGGEMFADAGDMMLAIEFNMTYEQWSEFYDQWVNSEGKINLNSWLMGARCTDKTRKHE